MSAYSVKVLSGNLHRGGEGRGGGGRGMSLEQLRTSWWIQLRDELRAHAQALHCDVILGYDEVVRELHAHLSIPHSSPSFGRVIAFILHAAR